MKKMKFRVLSGYHFDKDGEHGPGDIIETEVDLTRRFANKFERVYEELDDEGEVATDGVEAIKSEGQEPANQIPPRATARRSR